MSIHHNNVDDLDIFLASLSGMSKSEIVKSKELFIRNKIVDYKIAKETFTKVPWWYYIPPFVIFLMFRGHQMKILNGEKVKILNMLEIWKEELSYCYFDLREQIND